MENSTQQTQTFNANQSLMSSGGGNQGQLKSSGLSSGAIIPPADRPKITINLMDVSFLEQNLQAILEVKS
jgi:hypothetical protein